MREPRSNLAVELLAVLAAVVVMLAAYQVLT